MGLDDLANLGEFVGGFFVADFETFRKEMMWSERFDAEAIARWRRFVAGEGFAAPAPEPLL